MPNNGDTKRTFRVGSDDIHGLGSFHKTLPHDKFGEVDQEAFRKLVAATAGDGSGFLGVPKGDPGAAQFTNPEAGLANDQLTRNPAAYSMPPAPTVLSASTAAEMTELYWMALARDISFASFTTDPKLQKAPAELQKHFRQATAGADSGRLTAGIDLPGAAGKSVTITRQNIFRLGLPGEEVGPVVSQFFLRQIPYGTQTIDPRQRPYKAGRNYLTSFAKWLHAQNSGRDAAGQAYPQANEDSEDNFEATNRYIGTMRDLARFVNKDALHQAYFNAAIILLAGGAKWTAGNPYGDGGRLEPREAGFGVLGGPHILALVSEVATRALKIVWNQKWQVNLRLRPEAYGGLLQVQELGLADGSRRPYGLPAWLAKTHAAKEVRALNKAKNPGKEETLLLPMAFTPGSPTHPSYGAGHAAVAGCCVTVLKAFFKTFTTDEDGIDTPLKFTALVERDKPFGDKQTISTYITSNALPADGDNRSPLSPADADELTIEGELNKLAMNVAMGRTMGGVHWRSDNTRSLVLGEAIAAQILADITTDINEKPTFEFRTFTRGANGLPKKVTIRQGRIHVDGVLIDTNSSAL